MIFTPDEIGIISIYDTTDRETAVFEMEQALPHIDNAELAYIAKGALQKLKKLSDTEFKAIDFSLPFGGGRI